VSERGRRSRSRRQQTKDRVLQARIPQQLDEELKDRAEQLGLSVSTVVRNVLLHTFDLVEGVVADSAQLARVIQGREAPSPTATPAPAQRPESGNQAAVIGWQEAVLNRNGICEQCNGILPMGQHAAVGVPVQARPVLLCLDCLAGLTPAPEKAEANKKSPAKKARRNNKTSN
jgi:hypothetical protein